MATREQVAAARHAVRQARELIREHAGQSREQWADATMTMTCRRLRALVLGGLSHETWRQVIRETYPVGALSLMWVARFGRELIREPGVSREVAVAKLGEAVVRQLEGQRSYL